MAGGSSLSHTTLIIIAVCATVAGLVVLYAALRLVRSLHHRRAQRTTATLPPKQSLAHHREHYRSKLDERPWNPDPDLARYSPHPDSATDSVSFSSPMTSEPRLPLPNPSFHEFTPSPSSSETHLSQPTTPAPPRLARPLSLASLASSSVSRRHTLRGVPHAPHNHVQIVLPAPLAPGLAPRSRPGSLRWETDSDRVSVVDKWVPVGRDATSESPAPSPSRTSRRFSSRSVPSISPSSLNPPPPMPQLPSHTPDLERGRSESEPRRLHKHRSTHA